MNDPFAALYLPDPKTAEVFNAIGAAYTPPATFDHGKAYNVASIKAESENGQSVIITETALPARFFTIKAIRPGHAPWILSTGSGMEQMAAQIAKAIASGMLTHDN